MSVLIYVLLAVLLIVVGLVARKFATSSDDSMGSMSAQWLAEHRQGRS